MRGRVRFRRSILVATAAAALLVVALPGAGPAAAGTISECTESALTAAVAGGGSVRFALDCTIDLHHQLEIPAGRDVDIDAAGHRVELDAFGATRHFFVDGGDLTVIGLLLTHGQVIAGRGSDGLGSGNQPDRSTGGFGAEGECARPDDHDGSGEPGGNGTPGTNAPTLVGGRGGVGDEAMGGSLLIRRGTVTLNGATISGRATGGAGGSGGKGGDGGDGGGGGEGGAAMTAGTGPPFFACDPGTGGPGGYGADGGNGVDGGAAGAGGPALGGAIYNAGTLVVLDSTVSGEAVGGDAGTGGEGGAGGAGGDGGAGGRGSFGGGDGDGGPGGPAGRGGSGGAAGHQGALARGGRASGGGIYNAGSLSVDRSAVGGTARGGGGGRYGEDDIRGGAGGRAGMGGDGAPGGQPGNGGNGGAGGAGGSAGLGGVGGDGQGAGAGGAALGGAVYNQGTISAGTWRVVGEARAGEAGRPGRGGFGGFGGYGGRGGPGADGSSGSEQAGAGGAGGDAGSGGVDGRAGDGRSGMGGTFARGGGLYDDGAISRSHLTVGGTAVGGTGGLGGQAGPNAQPIQRGRIESEGGYAGRGGDAPRPELGSGKPGGNAAAGGRHGHGRSGAAGADGGQGGTGGAAEGAGVYIVAGRELVIEGGGLSGAATGGSGGSGANAADGSSGETNPVPGPGIDPGGDGGRGSGGETDDPNKIFNGASGGGGRPTASGGNGGLGGSGGSGGNGGNGGAARGGAAYAAGPLTVIGGTVTGLTEAGDGGSGGWGGTGGDGGGGGSGRSGGAGGQGGQGTGGTPGKIGGAGGTGGSGGPGADVGLPMIGAPGGPGGRGGTGGGAAGGGLYADAAISVSGGTRFTGNHAIGGRGGSGAHGGFGGDGGGGGWGGHGGRGGAGGIGSAGGANGLPGAGGAPTDGGQGARGGDAGPAGSSGRGGDAIGGAVFNAADGSRIDAARFEANVARGGNGASAAAGVPGGQGGSGGQGGNGGSGQPGAAGGGGGRGGTGGNGSDAGSGATGGDGRNGAVRASRPFASFAVNVFPADPTTRNAVTAGLGGLGGAPGCGAPFPICAGPGGPGGPGGAAGSPHDGPGRASDGLYGLAGHLGANGAPGTAAVPDHDAVETANSAPTISDLPDQALDLDEAVLVPFVVGDNEELPGSLRVVATSDNPTVAQTLVVGGEGGERTLDVRPGFHREGIAHVTVTVTDGAGLSASDPFTMTVGTPNDHPTLTVSAPSPVALGEDIRATARLSGGRSPTGQITFSVYGPDDPTCSNPPVSYLGLLVTGNGDHLSRPFTPDATGSYRWVAHYDGDEANDPVGTACNDPGATSEVRLPVDLTIAHHCVPTTLRPGEPTSCTVRVTNEGQIEATGVAVYLTLNAAPIDHVVGDGFSCGMVPSEGTPLLRCVRAALAVDASVVLTYRAVMPTFAAPGESRRIFGSVATEKYEADRDNNAADVDLLVRGVVLSLEATSDVLLGQPISATATLGGTSLPTGTITIRAYAPTDTTCSKAPSQTTTLTVNDYGSFTTEPFTPTVAGSYRWRLSWSGDENDPPSATACGALFTVSTVTPHAELSVTHTCTPAAVRPGSAARCTIVVTNTGPSTATDVVIGVDVPGGLVTIGSATASNLACVVQPDRSEEVRCTRPSLLRGRSATAKYTAVTYSDLWPDTVITSEAGAASSVADGDATDDVASASFATVSCTIDHRLDSAGTSITGTSGADVICMSPFADILRGAGGTDVLFGFDGRDTLDGGGGNDVLNGGAGVDTITGGAGDDLIFADEDSADSITCGAGNDTVYAVPGFDLIATDCERVLRL
jgi:uncharacterized repeat protein (TIGR01451 family)